jgi:hypothetical protein
LEKRRDAANADSGVELPFGGKKYPNEGWYAEAARAIAKDRGETMHVDSGRVSSSRPSELKRWAVGLRGNGSMATSGARSLGYGIYDPQRKFDR